MVAKKPKVKVMLSLEPEVVERIDVVAQRCKMDRSEFIATFMDISLESQEPFIDFAVALGRVKAKLVWPRWKPKPTAS